MAYNNQESKVFVSSNAIFLKEDYINNYKPLRKVLLEKLKSNLIKKLSTFSNDIQPNQK